ncbi:uncharacterized protein [Dermacentor albipictus]|uniref:uncharacterized protein isoform X2 n=1 Tax=Dermacentor albipictus TaxID=60249 RepID=UPI0038FD34D6
MDEDSSATAWLPSYENVAADSSDEPAAIALRTVKKRLLAACNLGSLLLSLVLLVVPAVLFLAPYARAARGDRDEEAEARRDVDREQFCEQPVPRFPFSAPTANATTTPIYDDKLLLQRPVICVLQNKHFRQQYFYQAAFTPFEYCTYVVLQFFHVTKTNPSYRTSHDADFLRSIVSESRKRTKTLRGQSGGVPILLGLGVDESDSSRFHHMVVADTVEVFVRAAMVHVDMDRLSGVHVNWLYPGGRCGDAADKTGLMDLLQKFRSLLPLPAYTLTVAVSTQSASKNYDLQGMHDVVDYIVVHAPDTYSTIECHFNRTAVTAAMYRFARTTGLTRKREPVEGKALIATYETVQNLQQRFDLGFADGIGGQCVAVYDLELDDYLGRCMQGFSPHLRVIAVEGTEQPSANVYSEIP